MEIERKYLLKSLPNNISSYPHEKIEQAYLCINPVLRIRKYGDKFFFTYKGSGLLARREEEFEIPKEDYYNLLDKHIGKILSKTRYKIPYDTYTIELDVFHGDYEGVLLAEVEFNSIEESENFTPPEFFKEDVTLDRNYHNSNMAVPTSAY